MSVDEPSGASQDWTLRSAIAAFTAYENAEATREALAALVSERDALIAAVLDLKVEIGRCESVDAYGVQCERWFARVGPTRHGRRQRFCSNVCKMRWHRRRK